MSAHHHTPRFEAIDAIVRPGQLRLSAAMLSIRTQPARIDRRDIRTRLVGGPVGLRDRLGRGLIAV